MISEFLKGTRDIIQALILLVVLIMLLKIFSLPDAEEIGDWVNYRRAIAHIEKKDDSLMSKAEGFLWRASPRKNKNKAIDLLCGLAKKGKEEAELLLLIYDKGIKDCPSKQKQKN